MADSRIVKTASILVGWATRVKPDDNVQVVLHAPEGDPLAREVYKQVLLKGAHPELHVGLPGITYLFYKYATDKQLKHFPKSVWYETKHTDVLIYIGSSWNTRELVNIDPKRIGMRIKTLQPIGQLRTNKVRTVLFHYPTNALAQDAGMSLAEYEDFVFGATNRDWSKEAKRGKRIASLVNQAKTVRIVGHNTDLTFSIAGRRAEPCAGNTGNMPGGEVATAPIRDSAQGYIEFTYPSNYDGNDIEGIYLEFKKGKVVKAKATQNERFLKAMLNLDKGASYLGEFAIGTNYAIKRFTKQILFDEKIGGTIHLAVGMAYQEHQGRTKAPLNRSALHWDMIKEMRPADGLPGGKLYFDGKMVYRNGKFIVSL